MSSEGEQTFTDLGDGVSLYIRYGPDFCFEYKGVTVRMTIFELRHTAEGGQLFTDPKFRFVTPAKALKAFELWMAKRKAEYLQNMESA